MKNIDYVWYASYGSNLCRERFLCYILGGQPEGSGKTERGCKDNSLPLKDKVIRIPHALYFAEYSQRWGGGVAYIGHRRIPPKAGALGRMYLIHVEQFLDVVRQENNDGIPISISDVQDAFNKGSKTYEGFRYGKILYIG
jgi:hypothetical protein